MPERPNRSNGYAAADPLDDLLTTLDVRVESFAVCRVREGLRLVVEPKPAVVIHFVLAGHGRLEVANAEPVVFGPRDVVIAPPQRYKTIAASDGPGGDVPAEEACHSMAGGLLVFETGEGGATTDLLTVCGIVQATYAGGFGLFDELAGPIVEDTSGVRGLSHVFDMLLAEIESPGLGGRALNDALMKQCLVLLLRERFARFSPDDPLLGRLRDPRLTRAVGAVLARPGDPHTLQSLAAEAGMSRSAFVARFLEVFAQTPFQFVQKVRLRQAAHLLGASDVPVKAIAESTGFSSRSYFSRAFKAVYGADPSRYRRDRGAAAPDAR